MNVIALIITDLTNQNAQHVAQTIICHQNVNLKNLILPLDLKITMYL